MKVSCPACGAEVLFKSRASFFGVCTYCSSTIVRHDKSIETFGKMSEIPQDMSPLQLGTTGIFEKSRFEIVGRQRIGWENGSWNEWYLYFDNGRDGWLADAQGQYMISFQEPETVKIPELAAISISKIMQIRGIDFSVNDIREVTCRGSQGELPVKSLQGRRSVSVDLVGNDNRFGNIDYSDDPTEGNRLFIGKYTEFENLSLNNLKVIDGW